MHRHSDFIDDREEQHKERKATPIKVREYGMLLEMQYAFQW